MVFGFGSALVFIVVVGLVGGSQEAGCLWGEYLGYGLLVALIVAIVVRVVWYFSLFV